MKAKRNNSVSDGDGGVSKKQYKLWLLAVIILVALWFMFAGSLTLKWSFGNLNPDLDDLEDLDVLEVEEREKVVMNMWDVYTRTRTHASTVRVPRFWSEAFQAAYEHLVSDVPAVRDAAVLEIAKMSLNQLQPHPRQSIKESRKMKQIQSSNQPQQESLQLPELVGSSQQSVADHL